MTAENGISVSSEKGRLIESSDNSPESLQGDGCISGDPLFISESENNFHLQKFSPAINSGSPVDAPITDSDGNPRLDEKGIDIGAFEYGSCAFR